MDFEHKLHLKVGSVEVELLVEKLLLVLDEKQLHQVSVASHCNVVQRGQPTFEEN